MGYIVFDTYMITSRLGYDDYIVAAIELYLDLVNLFLYILKILASNRNSR
jgi:FtsH-binding integral membrane protein